MDETTNNESNYRFKLNQTAKGTLRFEFTVKGDTVEEIKTRTDDLLKLAFNIQGVERLSDIDG